MKKDNRGSTLITVIVAIAFVTILTSIILTTTVMNMSMKGIDRRVKDDFYYAEKGLNDVYTGVGQITAGYAGKQYDKAFKELGKTITVVGQPDRQYGAEDAEKEFREQFLSQCYTEFHGAADLKAKLNAFIVGPAISSRINTVKVTNVGTVYYLNNDGGEVSAYDAAKTVAVEIKGISVAATDKDDYQSVITTDLVIECPTVDFLGLNAEVTDYAIIGCKGVYFTGSASKDTVQVAGNLYGGVHPTPITTPSPSPDDPKLFPVSPISGSKTPLYGGINILNSKVSMKGNYIVSKGDINVAGSGSLLDISSTDPTAGVPGVWFDTMRTVKGASSPEIRIKANMFALNDLELNADGSNVKFFDNCDYYGYNDKTLPSGSSLAAGDSLGYSAERMDDDSSAIIINGKSCTLDMSQIHTLALMGKAFVDFSSKGVVDDAAFPNKIAASAESIALQTNQQLYTVPIDFLEGPNPASAANYGSGFKLNLKREEMDPEYPSAGSEGWFGYKYVKQVPTTSSNKDQIVNDIFDVYKVKIDGEYVYWAYLKFNDRHWIKNISTGKYDEDLSGRTLGSGGSVSSKTAFFDEIMSATGADPVNAVQPTALRLKEKVLASAKNSSYFDLKGCLIDNSDARYATKVIYGRNAIVHYNTTPGSEEYKVKQNNAGMEAFATYPQNLFKRYKILCVSLDGKEDYKLTETPSTTAWENTKLASDWTKNAVTTPMSSFVLTGSLTGKDTSGATDRFIAGDTAGTYGACVIKNATFTIPAASNFKGVALINGDIIVESGATVDGLLMATGTITVNGGSGSSPTRILANKGLIQSRVEKEISLVEKGSAYADNFLISYLTGDGTTRMYNMTPGGKREEDRIKADYNSFMHFDNWRKGP